MIFDIVTIFPEFFSGPFDHGMVRRAMDAGLIGVRIHNLRDYTSDRHQVVDDRPFGGGEGMVLKPEPLFLAAESLRKQAGDGKRSRVILLSAHGRVFDQARAAALSGFDQVVLICGRYEGVDERVAENLADEELSIGDFILTGGELAAAVVVDAVSRLLPGVLGHEMSSVRESFSIDEGHRGILDCPHYTRPAEFRGLGVPEILLSGHHEQVRRWRRKMALEKTVRNRPDLLEKSSLSSEDRALLLEIVEERGRTT